MAGSMGSGGSRATSDEASIERNPSLASEDMASFTAVFMPGLLLSSRFCMTEFVDLNRSFL